MLESYMFFLTKFVDIVEIILNTISIYIVIKAIVIGTIKQKKKQESAKHTICKGISDALNYNLATEVMRIIVGLEGTDLLVIGAILILKAMITTLFMLELKQDEMTLNSIALHKKSLKRK